MLRRFAIGTALAATLILPLAGCGTSAPVTTSATSAAPTALPLPDPGDVLAAAVAKTTGVNLKVDMTDSTGDHFLGSYDGTNKVAALDQAPGGAGLKVVVTPEDYYIGGLKALRGQTWRVKIAKLADDSKQSLLIDALAPMTLLSEATGVQLTSPGAYSGHIDASLVRGTTAGAQKFLAHVNKSGGANAQTLIFTATVDEQGYLTDFKTTFPTLVGDKDVDYELKLSDFGSPVSITVPSGAKVVDAPAKAYASL
jgi:hypothetical protein